MCSEGVKHSSWVDWQALLRLLNQGFTASISRWLTNTAVSEPGKRIDDSRGCHVGESARRSFQLNFRQNKTVYHFASRSFESHNLSGLRNTTLYPYVVIECEGSTAGLFCKKYRVIDCQIRRLDLRPACSYF